MVAEESQVDPCFAVEVEPVVEVDHHPHFDYLVVEVGEIKDSQLIRVGLINHGESKAMRAMRDEGKRIFVSMKLQTSLQTSTGMSWDTNSNRTSRKKINIHDSSIVVM